LVYDHKLSSTDFDQVDGYLADKYGLYDPNATWPLAYSSAVQAEITLHQWNETQANNYVAMQAANTELPTNGLTLWLRADAGVTTSGTNVTTIADQTGNYTLSQTTTTNQPTYVASDLNGKPGLRFNGNQWLYSSGNFGPGLNQDMTIITVGMTTSPSTEAFALYLGQNASVGANRDFVYYDGLEDFDGQGVGCGGGAAAAANTFVSEIASLNSALTRVTFYQNGELTTTNTVSGTFVSLSPDITMGAATGGYDGWKGDIVEQLVYDHQLSSTELQGLGVYLTNKYNLPFYGTVPTISPNGGSYSSTQSVSITTTQTGTLYYTLDGTTPTPASPAYSGSISVSASALVQAAVFSSGGAQLSDVASAQFYINDSGHTGLPGVPTGLSVTNASATENDLSWSLPSFVNFSQVYVYRSTNSGAYELIAVLGAGATSYADTNVAAGNSYTYEVGTLNQAGVSDTSPSSSVTPSASTSWSTTLTTPTGALPWPP